MPEPHQSSLFDAPDQRPDQVEPPPPPDQAARDRITSELDHTLFVEAGAGSGKTKALVDRVLALIRAGVPMREIVAITFTDRAAAELRERIRTELISAPSDPAYEAALGELDGAAVATLHAFAQRILREHPVEAGLPVGFEVLDEIASEVEFDRRWQDFQSMLLSAPQHEHAFLLADAADLDVKKLRTLATEFARNWDLIETHRTAMPSGQPPEVDPAALISLLREVAALGDHCLDAGDRLLEKLEVLPYLADDLANAPTPYETVSLLDPDRPPISIGNAGTRSNWPSHCSKQEVVAAVKRVKDLRAEMRDEIVQSCLATFAAVVADFTLEHARARQHEGRLQFHDLLVLARKVLRDPEHGRNVRASLRSRYTRLLLDEFQDTDPIQVELATLLATSPETVPATWEEAPTDPGRLFFVGDPKQSIYRFRRADIRLFLDARSVFGNDDVVELSTTFRCGPRITDWINHVFESVIQESPGSQPAYHALQPTRSDSPRGPGVVILGAEAHSGGSDPIRADALREREAADVAAVIKRIRSEGWLVEVKGEWRPAGLGDICILLPARTSLVALQRALDDADVPSRAETHTLVYASREIRELMAILTAIGDASNELALVTALRSPAFGCGDDDLLSWHRAGGRWRYLDEKPPSVAVDHPVAIAMAALAEYHDAQRWSTPAELIDRVLADRRLFEVAGLDHRNRDLWRHLRFVADQARAWTENVGGDLRSYLTWAKLQSSDSARVAEPVLAEEDEDAVRIMTIHGSKGLEFPITILSGMTTRPRAAPRGVQAAFPPGRPPAVRYSKDAAEPEFEHFRPIDEQMDSHEKLRLLYVAATRCRDHLVVSCHRAAPKSGKDEPAELEKMSAAQVVWHAVADLAPFDDHAPSQPAVEPMAAVAAAACLATAAFDVKPGARAAFIAAHDAAISRASRPHTLAATGVASLADHVGVEPGLDKDVRETGATWGVGRYGTALGRAVHGTLQVVDLRSGAGLDSLARAQAEAEGIAVHSPMVAARVRAALAADCVRAATASRFWREVFVAAPVGDQVVEGYIDLLYESPDGLVVVDYKTDDVRDGDLAPTRIAHYRLQLGTYAHALQEATGRPVARAMLCLLDDDVATEVEILDLPGAIENVRELVAGSERI